MAAIWLVGVWSSGSMETAGEPLLALVLAISCYTLRMGAPTTMRRHSTLGSMRLLVVAAAAVFCACGCVLLVADQYYWAQHELKMYKQDLQGWEACRTTKPAFYRSNIDAVTRCANQLIQAKENFWVTLPKEQLLGLYAMAGLGGAAGGALASWLLLFMIGRALRLAAGHWTNRPAARAVGNA